MWKCCASAADAVIFKGDLKITITITIIITIINNHNYDQEVSILFQDFAKNGFSHMIVEREMVKINDVVPDLFQSTLLSSENVVVGKFLAKVFNLRKSNVTTD